MKSTIRVDFQGPETSSHGGFEPVIRVTLVDSDDTRDKLLKTFFQALGGKSSWLQVKFDQSMRFAAGMDGDHIVISPVKAGELDVLQSEVENRIGNAPKSPEFFSRFTIGDNIHFTTAKAKQYAFEQARKEKIGPDTEIEFIPEYFYGKIAAVKFTAAKVWYDILDDYSGKVFEDIPSNDVKVLDESLENVTISRPPVV